MMRHFLPNQSPAQIARIAIVIGCLFAPVVASAQDFAPPVCLQKYSFYPQGGNFFGDLFPNNFVDVDPGAGLRDWNCGTYTQDGHDGIDTDIRGFAAQVVGVPVFAVLDGIVTETHDGEPDMNTRANTPADARSNLVRINHGAGHVTSYLHLKKDSVAVSVGQQVRAGQQIGLTGSSGQSYGPHLHFGSEVNGVPFEPFAGPCRPGVSNWTAQPAFRTDMYVTEFVITGDNLDLWDGPPQDTTRTGTFLTGNQRLGFWMTFANSQLMTSFQARILKPDGSIFRDSGRQNIAGVRRSFYFGRYPNPNLDVPGTWHIEVLINDQVFIRAPFTVLSEGPIVNRPPAGVQAAFDPPSPIASDVVFCRVTQPTFFLDPDYDMPRFRYVWKVNDTVVREIVSAALSDAIPRNSAQAGDTLTCTVTPSDGVADGPSTTVSVPVRAPADAADKLLNISTRLRVQTGENVLIGGVIAVGNAPKKVMIRAIGPSLAAAGVQGPLADPTIELRTGDTLLASNDNWRTGGQEEEILASSIAPVNDLEAALITTLQPNQGYTAVVRGKDGGTGIGLVEAYDLEQTADSRLANISTRGFVETEDNVLIAGFIIGGERRGSTTVLVRALGPSLAKAGVANPLQNPILELVNSNGVLQSVNDDWRECQEEEITATTIPPSNDRESAIVQKLPPGAYTAIVRGVNNTTGVALVEVYNLIDG